MRPSAATALCALMFWLGMTLGAVAQEHKHPTETIYGPTAHFYETWMRPDQPTLSCCNKADCYATEARFRDGQWRARRREDGKWLSVPPEKIEQNRDSPDGRNHLCAPPPAMENAYTNGVICFLAGAGG